MAMPVELVEWRKSVRKELLARRTEIDEAKREQWNEAITQSVLACFPFLGTMTVGFYWPYMGEPDGRFAVRHFRKQGAVAALPMVANKGEPLRFLEWWPGAPMRKGVFDIPFPSNTRQVHPRALLIAPVGFDAAGYRLGYGGGYYDRTLATMPLQPLKIALAFEVSRVGTIHPQPHDIPMDFIITERGVHHVGRNRLDLIEDTEEVQRRAREIMAERVAAAAARQPTGTGN